MFTLVKLFMVVVTMTNDWHLIVRSHGTNDVMVVKSPILYK